MIRRALLLAALGAAFAAAPAGAAIQVAITSPAVGDHSLGGIVPVQVTASADAGIYGVQLKVDGAPYAALDTTQTSPYQYAIAWDTTGLAPGDHTLTVTAYDWSAPFPLGAALDSPPVTVDVGPAYPTVSLTVPPPWTFVRGTTTLAAAVTSAVDPTTLQFAVDGSALAGSSWNTASVADGSHQVSASVTDGRGKSAVAVSTVTVDNTPPSAAILSPAPNASFTGTMPVAASVSDGYGVGSVAFAIDGTPAATPAQTDPSAPYTYRATLPLTGLVNGVHQLTVLATDQAGNTTISAAVPFTIGTQPPTVVLTLPPDWTFARGTVPVTATVTGGAAPTTVTLVVDGKPTTQTATSSPFVFPWDTSKLADGAHTLAASVTDSLGRSATSALVHQTVDNTPPTAYLIAPTANQRVQGQITLQAHASDAYGVRSVQFLVDGAPVGTPLTTPDSGQQYVYSLAYDTSLVPAGGHTVAAVITDNAGNTTTLAPTSIATGSFAYLPVLNYHEILSSGATIYDSTPAEADAQLKYLHDNGYQSVTLEQYQQWLGGASIGVAKPVLITVDDALKTELAWDPLLQKYGFKAVMFVITGYVDQKTPGDDDPNNMTWTDLRNLAATGRWQIAFHAGQYGHGDAYGTGAKINGASYTPVCEYFYTCFSQTTVNRKLVTESFSTYKTQVTNEVTAGIAELKQQVPSASLVAWAAPFNDAGQWTNLYNDPSGQAQAWFPAFMASRFPIVFTQTNPVTYGQAPGSVGALNAFNRHYRYEVDRGTTIAQFAAALADPAFVR